LSLVCVFFNCFLAWISPKNPAGLPAGIPPPALGAGIGGGGGGPPGAPPIPGIGGGGGAPIDGIGGGGGAPIDGIGGGDGTPIEGMGGGSGAPVFGIGGGGGGDVGPLATAGLLGPEPCPAAERGRAGPILPNSIAARALAPRALGPSSSDESSSLSDPAADQSSSSKRRRDGLVPVGWATGCSALGTSWLEAVRRNGLLETAGWEGASAACGANFLKNGFFVSGSAGVTGMAVLTAGVETGGTKEGTGGGGGDISRLFNVGVEA